MKISIALTTHNGSRFLRQQLDSLFEQTRLPDEIVVCDDCSTDDTLAILHEYARQHPELRIHTNEHALGVNANFFKAIALCTGDYISICDQDDVWMSHKVATLADELSAIEESGRCAVVSSLRQDVDAEGHPIAPPQHFPAGKRWHDTLINTEQSQGCTMMMNRAAATLALEYYRQKPDANLVMYDVLIACLAAVFGIKSNLDQPLMYYRHHDTNIVDKLRKKKKTFWEKVHEMPTYYPFLHDYRISELAVIDAITTDSPMPSDIRRFLHTMTLLNKTESIFMGLPLVLRLPQLSLKRRLCVLILTPMVKTLKIIERCL